MEEKITEKKVWESPDVEMINSKMTKGAPGVHVWDHEDAYYTDVYAS